MLELGVADPPHVFLEYDGEYYHKNVERDVKKTQRLLEHDSHAMIVRVRVGNLPLLSIDDPRVIFAHIQQADPRQGRELAALAHEMAEHVPEPLAGHLRSAHADDRPVAEHVTEAAMQLMDAMYKAEVEVLEQLIGDPDAVHRFWCGPVQLWVSSRSRASMI